MDIAQIRGMTEDHPSSEDEAPKKAATATKASAPKAVPTISRSEGVRDPHDLIRGITEDHSSDEDWKPKKSPPINRPRQVSGSKPKGPTGDPHRQLRAMTDDVWSSEEEDGKSMTGPGANARKPRGSSSGGKSGGKSTLDPHALIRGLTEDHWSSDEGNGKASSKSSARKLSNTGASANLKKPLSDTRPRLSSNSLRPDNTHDLIRGLTEDVWSSDEDKPQTSPRKSSTSSARAAAGGGQSTLVVGSPKKPSLSLNKSISPQIKPATLVAGGPKSPTSPGAPIRVLFVCLGNICRSPMAHGVLQYLTRPGYLPRGAPPVRVDSAGTGAYHALSPPDARTLELFKIHNIKSFVHKARRVRAADFWDVDYMLCMDAENLQDLRQRRKTLMEKAGDKVPKAKIQLFGEYGGNQTEIVEDPYYGSNEGFDVAWEQVVRMARGFLKDVAGVNVDTRDLMGMV